ncbi:DNA helicase [Pontivivens ytuae]|uniref:AAA family ATPase n=1 Tax=Pontivivens ytuae TaxID=2789856 RepID=A0A7S9QDE5_9RHOB|nr:DNA helicase [Pontivivens ytuae]QPH55203.1 AAA family ATPase [Pontivivens ytuae]
MRLSAPVFRLKRRAKLLSRTEGIPLHAALDRLAAEEGFRSWSHLSTKLAEARPARRILDALTPGDLVLLGARPGHGKTLLGLELLCEALGEGWAGLFFTLDYTEADVHRRLVDLGPVAKTADRLILDTSDAICADHVIGRLAQVDGPALAVIDYLQLLDQDRRHPPLGQQVEALSAYARTSGAVIVAISQIDRRFDLAGDGMPGLGDVRLPNPVDLTLFTRTCFLHDGAVRVERTG